MDSTSELSNAQQALTYAQEEMDKCINAALEAAKKADLSGNGGPGTAREIFTRLKERELAASENWRRARDRIVSWLSKKAEEQ